jgi:hypothetical protein
MTDTVKCVRGPLVDLDDGRQVLLGEVARDVDLGNEHNKTLIEEGRLLRLTPAQAKKYPTTHNKEGADQ